MTLGELYETGEGHRDDMIKVQESDLLTGSPALLWAAAELQRQLADYRLRRSAKAGDWAQALEWAAVELLLRGISRKYYMRYVLSRVIDPPVC